MAPASNVVAPPPPPAASVPQQPPQQPHAATAAPALQQGGSQWSAQYHQPDPFAVPPAERAPPAGGASGGLDEGLDSLLDFLGGGAAARASANGAGATRAQQQQQPEQQRPPPAQQAQQQHQQQWGGGVAASATNFDDVFGLPSGGPERPPLFSDEEPPPPRAEQRQPEMDPLDGGVVAVAAPLGQGYQPARPARVASAAPAAAGKPKSRGSIDLEEARRRTALLMGDGAYSRRSSSGSVGAGMAGAAAEAAPVRREPPPLATRPQMPADPLGAGSSDAGGSYFNEDLLRQRQARAATYGSTYPYDANEQDASSAWDTGAILGRAGSMVSAAKSGAKSLLQRANGYGNAGGGAGGAAAGGSYDVTFGDGRLGFTMLKSEQGLGVVCKVQPDSTAASAGVSPGDTVVAINRRRMSSYDEVMSVLPSMPRPVLVTFAKPDGEPQLANGQAALTGGGAWEADGQGSKGWLGNLDPFKSGKRRSSAGLSGDNASWRVENQDLQFRRPDFHGVVVHAHNGVFSWSLYGTSDGSEAPGARLSTGDTYTEYVMRCQWGPDLQHMSPWMVARRYREFDALDKDLREVFPHLKDSFPSLPPKELFKTSQEVVSRRRVGLEQYMTFLIGNCPDVLCCPQMNRFLGIDERIAAIKGQGGLRRGSSGAPAGGGGGGGAAVPSLSASTSSGPLQARLLLCATEASSRITVGCAALVGTDYLLNLMTAGEAYDLMRARAGALRPLTRAGLQAVEEAVRRLRQRVDDWGRGVAVVADPLHDAELHGLAEICQQSWPALKATAARADDTPEGMDMLPSVLQCDEDIERLLAWLSVLAFCSE
ncbi:hypothetical protein JKP88DRAFT_323841 [Tribonema minus]|uniref:PX domain-containing protein n=1 Tax=Tribonema minus TaxID=303371 RepID=A0A835YRV1_9STRA|nr:hypothetical protein JKP88DRAFT_323841 [Tribonema minus]